MPVYLDLYDPLLGVESKIIFLKGIAASFRR